MCLSIILEETEDLMIHFKDHSVILFYKKLEFIKRDGELYLFSPFYTFKDEEAAGVLELWEQFPDDADGNSVSVQEMLARIPAAQFQNLLPNIFLWKPGRIESDRPKVGRVKPGPTRDELLYLHVLHGIHVYLRKEELSNVWIMPDRTYGSIWVTVHGHRDDFIAAGYNEAALAAVEFKQEDYDWAIREIEAMLEMGIPTDVS